MEYILFERYFMLLPNERYALTCPMMESYENKIMVVDTVEKNIVSQADLETKVICFFLCNCSFFYIF